MEQLLLLYRAHQNMYIRQFLVHVSREQSITELQVVAREAREARLKAAETLAEEMEIRMANL